MTVTGPLLYVSEASPCQVWTLTSILEVCSTHFTDGDTEAPGGKVSCPGIYELHKLNPGAAAQSGCCWNPGFFQLMGQHPG